MKTALLLLLALTVAYAHDGGTRIAVVTKPTAPPVTLAA